MNDKETNLLIEFAHHSGKVMVKNQNFQFFIYSKNRKMALFILDPKTQGMSLTNCCEDVVIKITNDMYNADIASKEEICQMIESFSVHLRDTNDEWARIGNKNYKTEGLQVRVWEHFNFSKEYLKLFSLLG